MIIWYVLCHMSGAGYKTGNETYMRPALRQFTGIKRSYFLQLLSQYEKDTYVNMQIIIIQCYLSIFCAQMLSYV